MVAAVNYANQSFQVLDGRVCVGEVGRENTKQAGAEQCQAQDSAS